MAGTGAIGEEPIVADTDEALGEDVQQEATGELTERERAVGVADHLGWR